MFSFNMNISYLEMFFIRLQTNEIRGNIQESSDCPVNGLVCWLKLVSQTPSTVLKSSK